MPPISEQKIRKIKEQILFYLYNSFPKQVFTSDIARELARDEEFIKRMLEQLVKDQLIVKIEKNPKGIKYSKRRRWRLSNKVQEAYSKHQTTTKSQLRL